jgi:uncharacterized phage protein (TIGR02218 family)
VKTGISVALKAHLALGSPTMATCWKATLTNGTVLTATALDRAILAMPHDGLTYLSTAAFTPSDVESSNDLAPDNLELEGFLASPLITDEDIHSGIWDYAAIEIFAVNYKDLTMGRDRIREGTLGEVKGGRAQFRAELRGLTQSYSRKIVRLINKECDADVGDARCGVDLGPFTVTGTIDAVTNDREFTDAARTEEADWFTAGKITFTSGENSALGAAGADLSMEVKKSTAAGLITLHHLMPFTVAVGDTYSMYAGCTKRKTEDCGTKFDNVVNHRGFDLLPESRAFAGPQS